MANRETRKEQYEDALFALLMDEMAQEDGEELLRLNEALKQDPNAAVPEAVQHRCEKVIGTAFSRRQFQTTGRRTARWFGRLLLAAILGILLFSAAFALSEDVRVATLNIVLEVMDDHTRITFEEDPSGGAGQSGSAGQPDTTSGLEYHYNIALEWIPEGFELDSGHFKEEGTSDYVSYVNSQNGVIDIRVTPYSTGLVSSLNTEECEKKDITVQNHPATLYVTSEDMLETRYYQYGVTNIWNQMMIYWIDEELQVIVQIDATNLTEEEMIRLAEGVHWRGSSDLEYHYNIALGWIPEGFELDCGNYEENGTSDYVIYRSPQDGMIEVCVTPYSAGLVSSLNTEDCTKQDVTVNDHSASLYITNDDMLEMRYHQNGFPNIWSDMMIFWIDQDAQANVQINATNLTEEEMIRLAEGVHWLHGTL